MREKILLHQKDLEGYRDTGYLVVPELFDATECITMELIFEDLATEGYPPIINLNRQDSRVANISKASRVTRIVEALQDSLISIGSTTRFYKKAHSIFSTQAWNVHQDASYSGTGPGVYITANIALGDMDKENGSLYIYPGSHKEGILPFESKPTNNTDSGNKIIDLDAIGDSIDLELTRGSVFFMCGELAHGSYANNSDRDRPMFCICYVKRGAEFFRGSQADREEIYVV